MKLEKRSSGAAETETSVETGAAGKKPVIIYIMILFIVAFLLMALSFVMHQRSNSEVLGELQSSVSAMQEIQNTQEQMAALQTQLDELEKEKEELSEQLDAANQNLDTAQQGCTALQQLYVLEREYAAGDLDACRNTLQEMEDLHLVDALRPVSDFQFTPNPMERYEQLKEAVLNA